MLVLHMKVDKVSDEEDDKVAKGTLVNVVSQVNLCWVGRSNSRSCSCTLCMILHFARSAHYTCTCSNTHASTCRNTRARLLFKNMHPGVCLEISVHPFNSAVDISQSWSGLSRCWSGLQRREDHEEEEGEAKVVHDAQLESWHRSKLDDVSTDRLFIHE